MSEEDPGDAPGAGMRCFLGIPITPVDALCRMTSKAEDRLRRYRLTRPAQWHVTLAFFPDLQPQLVEQIIQDCTPVLRVTPAFTAQICGFGAFPSPERAAVVWLRLEPARRFQEIWRVLRPCLPLTSEDSLTPHVTVARKSRNSRHRQDTATVRDLCQKQWQPVSVEISEVVLYRSLPVSRGSEYQRLHVWSLAGGSHADERTDGDRFV